MSVFSSSILASLLLCEQRAPVSCSAVIGTEIFGSDAVPMNDLFARGIVFRGRETQSGAIR